MKMLPSAVWGVLAYLSISSVTHAASVLFTPDPPFVPTGANVNAIAGPLPIPPADLDAVDIAGETAGAVSAAAAGNTATHTYTIKPGFALTPAFFEHEFSDFSRTTTEDNRATAEGIFLFMVDEPVFYEIFGFFSVDDDNDAGPVTPGRVELEIVFADISPPGPPVGLFSNYQVSEATEDQTFFVGGTDGDTIADVSGAPFGMLLPGSVYSLRFLVNILALEGTDATATADGALTVIFTPVPEPSGVVLGLLALGGMTILIVRRAQPTAHSA